MPSIYTTSDLGEHLIAFSSRSAPVDIELYKKDTNVAAVASAGLDIGSSTTEAVTDSVSFRFRIGCTSVPASCFLATSSNLKVDGVPYIFEGWNVTTSKAVYNSVECWDDALSASGHSEWVEIRLPLLSLSTLALDLAVTSTGGSGTVAFNYDVELDGITKYNAGVQWSATANVGLTTSLSVDILSDLLTNYPAVYTS